MKYERDETDEETIEVVEVIDDPESPEMSSEEFFESSQQVHIDSEESSSESDLGAFQNTSENEEFKEPKEPEKQYTKKRIIPPEYNDQEYDQMNKSEQLETTKNNIFAFVGFVALFFLFLQIILGSP